MDSIIKPVYWTTRSSKDLEKITRFNIESRGKEKARELSENIQKSTEVLENPNYDFMSIGTVDIEFSHLKRQYRKIFCDGHKITYREGKTKIYIVRVFDMRQHPSKNK